jgi:hypothetical protein
LRGVIPRELAAILVPVSSDHSAEDAIEIAAAVEIAVAVRTVDAVATVEDVGVLNPAEAAVELRQAIPGSNAATRAGTVTDMGTRHNAGHN